MWSVFWLLSVQPVSNPVPSIDVIIMARGSCHQASFFGVYLSHFKMPQPEKLKWPGV